MTDRVRTIWNAGEGHAVLMDGVRVLEGESQAIADAVAYALVQYIKGDGQQVGYPSECQEIAHRIYVDRV